MSENSWGILTNEVGAGISDCSFFFRNLSCLFLFQVLPDSLKKKDDVDGTSTVDEFVAVAVSGARGRISCLSCLILGFDNSSSFSQGVTVFGHLIFISFDF